MRIRLIQGYRGHCARMAVAKGHGWYTERGAGWALAGGCLFGASLAVMYAWA